MKTMKKMNYILPIAALLLLAACSSDDGLEGDTSAVSFSSPVELTLSTGVSTTRALTALQSTQIEAGEKVYVWVDEHTKPTGNDNYNSETEDITDFIRGWVLTADGAGNWRNSSTSPTADYQKQYYPASGYPVDIYAVHGNLNKEITFGANWQNINPADPNQSTLSNGMMWTALNTGLIHTVKPNQTGTAVGSEAYTDGYSVSDLLYARAYDRKPQRNAQPLTFTHLLSKIQVYIIPGEGMTGDRIYAATVPADAPTSDWRTKVELINVRMKTAVELKKRNGNERKESGDNTGEPSNYYTLTSQENSEGTVLARMQYNAEGESLPEGAPSTLNGKKAFAFADAIIVPQHVNSTHAEGGSAVDFIRITLPSGGIFYVQTSREFQTGLNYTYYVTLSTSGLTVVTQVQDWVDGTDAINASDKTPSAKLERDPVVGDFYFADGTWGTASWGSANSKTPIGIVFSTNTSAKDKALGFKHGYVMALGNAQSGQLWCADKANASGTTNLQALQVTDGLIPWNDTRSAANFHAVIDNLDGLTHCLTAKDNAAKATGYEFSDLTAIYAAMVTYNTVVSAPANSSGWYLPSIGQQYLWMESFGKNMTTYSNFFPGPEKVSNWNWNYNSIYLSNGIALFTAMNDYVKTCLSETSYISSYTEIGSTTEEQYYWSSTERDATYTWYFRTRPAQGTDGGNINLWTSKTKGESLGDAKTYVRPVLAF